MLRLQPSNVTLAKTFISLERTGEAVVENLTFEEIKFQWKQHESPEEEGKLGQIVHEYDARSNQLVARSRAPYENEVFTIEPLQGEIPAKGKVFFRITFNPKIALQYDSIAYLQHCNADGNEVAKRAPLLLSGCGIGPDCCFSYDAMDVGEIFINSVHKFEVHIENRGSIDAQFAMREPTTKFGRMFTFKPSSGRIVPGQTQSISMSFCSDLIGIMSEIFAFQIRGSKDDLLLHVKGSVIGPTFYFDKDELDFGKVSYNFVNRQSFNIFNTSGIPMRFLLRVPEDGVLEKKEFTITPHQGMILPKGKTHVVVDFLSNTVQEYNCHLVVDVDDVGDNLESIPISATCVVPDVELSRESLDFGQCFVGYPYLLTLEAKNDSPLPAKFEISVPGEEDPVTRKVSVEVDQSSGIINEKSILCLRFTLNAKQVGSVHLPVYLRILGSDKPPFPIGVSAKIVGPIVTCDTETLDFGVVNVLQQANRKIILTNQSPIAAKFTAHCVGTGKGNEAPTFTLPVAEGTIGASSSLTFAVAGFLNEVMKFKDQLVIVVMHSAEIHVQLAAMGKGTPCVPDIDLDNVDFGSAFTTQVIEKTFTIENKGRKQQQISWTNERGSKPKDGTPPFVFVVTPERAVLNPKCSETFTVRGLSAAAGKMEEKILCKQGNATKPIYTLAARAEFFAPFLEFSKKALAFSYVYDQDSILQSQLLTIKNVSPLRLEFSVKCTSPFTVDKSDYVLVPGESASVSVDFDAAHSRDNISRKYKSKFVVTYKDHPNKDSVDLNAEVAYPNLQLENTIIDFGCVLNVTQRNVKFRMTNTSKVNVEYKWLFEDDQEKQPQPKDFNTSIGSSQSSAANPKVYTLFDISPIRGVLRPGEEQVAEFSYFGQALKKVKALAICQVVGGPEYSVQLVGEASNILFRFDKNLLDFGAQPYDKAEQKELFLFNSGKVPFPFTVDLGPVSKQGLLEVLPMEGVVKGNDKVKILVKFRPSLPDEIDETFKVQVAHYESYQVRVKARGLYLTMHLNLPRANAEEFESYLLQAAKAKPGSQMEVDTEAERLFFTKILSASLSEEPPANPVPKYKVGNGETKLVIAKYVCDFGPIVKGDTKRKVFKVTNTSYTSASFQVEKRSFNNTGVAFSLEKRTKLNEGEAMQIEVSFNTKAATVGPFSLEVPLDITQGPVILLELKAEVIVPVISLSVDRLDFGIVRVGHSRLLPILLHNTKPLPCEWQIGLHKDTGASSRRNATNGPILFRCTPESGVLQPGEWGSIKVSFSPVEGMAVQQMLAFRVSHNPRQYFVTCAGNGQDVSLTVSPPEISLGPVLPFSAVDRPLTIANNSAFPVEVYSRNFDRQYIVEDEILANVEGYDANNVMLLNVREVGDVLPDELMEMAWAKLMAEDKKFEDMEKEIDGAIRSEDRREGTATSSISESAATLSEAPKPVEDTVGPVIVVAGPPLSGKTTLCHRIQKATGYPVLRLDEVFSWFMQMDSDEGQHLRRLVEKKDETAPNEEIITSCIISKLSSPPYRSGVIVDGINCGFVLHQDVIFRSLLAVAKHRKAYYECLMIDAPLIEVRRAALAEAAARLEVEQARVEHLDEDDYDRLPQADQDLHQQRLARQKAALKRLAAAVKQREKMEEERGKLTEIWTVEQQMEKEEEEERKKQEALLEAEKGKKKAPEKPKKGKEEPPPPQEPLTSLSSLQLFKKFHKSVAQLANAAALQPFVPEEPKEDKVEAVQEVKKEVEKPSISPETRQCVTRPQGHPNPEDPVYFTLGTKVTEMRVKEEDTPRAKKPAPKGKKGKEEEEVKMEAVEVIKKNVTRWVLQAGEVLPLFVGYSSDVMTPKEGLEKVLSFGVVGSQHTYSVRVLGICQYPEVSSDPKLVFRKRTKKIEDGKFACKQYVLNRKRFEFGPLLVGRKSDGYANGDDPEQTYPEHCEKLKVTNTGVYHADVDFCFLEEGASRPFLLHPPKLSLPPGASQPLYLWAFPDKIGLIQNTLLAVVKDNPQPVMFDVNVVGARPEVTVDGSTEPKTIDFDRLLLRSPSSVTVTVANSCSIPVNWTFKEPPNQKLPPEFTVVPFSGTLTPGQNVQVTFSFKVTKANVYSSKLELQVSDVKNVKGVSQTIPFSILGEGFDVYVETTKFVDFGVIRVGQPAVQQIQMLNRGKYDVNFSFSLHKKLTDVFAVAPLSGVLKPGKEKVTADLTFLSKKELVYKENLDFHLKFTEPRSNEHIGTAPIPLSVKAFFNKFTMAPEAGLNFGACMFGVRKTMTFDIVNTGTFDMKFRLFPFEQGLPAESWQDDSAVDPKKKKAAAASAPKPKAKGKEAQQADMQLGAFGISPGAGTVPPGSTQTITVVLQPEGKHVFKEVLGIDIADRDPTSFPQGIPYTLEGESCVPGIFTDYITAPEKIFEEQRKESRLDPKKKIFEAVFIRDDRTFSFGIVMADGRKVTEQIKIINPNKVDCTVLMKIRPRGDAKEASSLAEAFDLNTEKMQIQAHSFQYVTIGFKPSALTLYYASFEAIVENGQDAETKQLKFELRGEGALPCLLIDTPPPPSGLVKVEETSAAAVPGKAAAKGRPQSKEKDSKSPSKPAAKGAKGAPAPVSVGNQVVFPRTIVGERSQSFVSVTNASDLPTSVRFTFTTHPAFSFPQRNKDIPVAPRSTEKFAVFFDPKAEGRQEAKLTMLVPDNRFEDATVMLSGEGHVDIVTFTEIDEGTENVLTLGDCAVATPKAQKFLIVNHTDSAIRFLWTPPSEHFTISPAVGHLQAKATKDISVSFYSDKPVDYPGASCKAVFQMIKYTQPVDRDWDDRRKIVKWSPNSGQGEDAKSKTLKKVVEVESEPAYSVLPGEPTTKFLITKIVCNYSRYQLICPNVTDPFTEGFTFSTTGIHLTRAYLFTLRNVGRVGLQYQWNVGRRPGQDDATVVDYYTVQPASGYVEPGLQTSITVSYTPLDVNNPHLMMLNGTFDHVLAEAPTNPQSLSCNAAIPLAGTAVCPLVHFEIPTMDESVKRLVESVLASDEGRDADTRVLEFLCRGVKIKTTRQFFVLNPTNMSYEFEWEFSQGEQANFSCKTPKGVIHPGKKYKMIFEFISETLDPSKCQFRFHIPERKLTIPFLLVGLPSEPDIQVDKARVNFETVLLGTKGKQTINIVNNEPLPYAFAFDKLEVLDAKGKQQITVSPVQGTIPSNSKIAVELGFSPATAGPYNYTLVCRVKKMTSPLTVNIKGEGYSAPLQETLNFQTHVRQVQTKQVKITNTTSFPWNLQPKIDNPLFVGYPTVVKVNPNEVFMYSVSYNPLITTKNKPDTLPDKGTLAIKLPTGGNKTYLLEGVADDPLPAGDTTREIRCKKLHKEKFVVHNWLKTPQKFKVARGFNVDASSTVNGENEVEISGGGKLEYELSVLCYKDAKLMGKVTFTNAATAEYIFYNFTFRALPAVAIETLVMRTPVRQKVRQEITLENPLVDKPITLVAKCESPDVSTTAPVTVPGGGTAKLTVMYFPLIAKAAEIQANLALTCPELGDFPYKLILQPVAAPPERTVRFECWLGASQTQTLRFTQFCKSTDYTCKFSDPKLVFSKANGQNVIKVSGAADKDKKAGASAAAAASGDDVGGTEVSFDVNFEPSSLGESHDTLIVSSPQGGDYVFLLIGHCSLPQRQGPIDIRANGSIQLPFKNVFSENTTFTLACEPACFTVNKLSEVVPMKKSTTFTVSFKPTDDNYPVRGKIVISAAVAEKQAAALGAPEEEKVLKWVYYLRGIKQETVGVKGAK